MHERIKRIRQSAEKTQLQFAEAIGLSRNYIAMIEIGQREPSDRTISDICEKFNVNRDWLLTGRGEMLNPVSRDAEITAFMGDVMKGEDADFRRRLVAALAKLDLPEWELLEKIALKLAEENKKEDRA